MLQNTQSQGRTQLPSPGNKKKTRSSEIQYHSHFSCPLYCFLTPALPGRVEGQTLCPVLSAPMQQGLQRKQNPCTQPRTQGVTQEVPLLSSPSQRLQTCTKLTSIHKASYSFTPPWTCRKINTLLGHTLKDHIAQCPCHKQGHLHLNQDAYSLIQNDQHSRPCSPAAKSLSRYSLPFSKKTYNRIPWAGRDSKDH